MARKQAILVVVVLLFAVAFGGCKLRPVVRELPPPTGGGQTSTQPSLPVPTETSEVETRPHIPGLLSGDIKVGLSQVWGLKFTGPEPGVEVDFDHGEVIDPDTGVLLECDILEDSPFAIVRVEFTVDASYAAGSIGADLVDALAAGYFGYCATVPYEGADPDKARAWVERHASEAIGEGNVLTTEIGGVLFEMYGSKWIRFLEVKPKPAGE